MILVSQSILQPDPSSVAATEQYFSIESAQALWAFSGIMEPFISKIILMYFHLVASLPSSLSPSMSMRKASTVCFCFSKSI